MDTVALSELSKGEEETVEGWPQWQTYPITAGLVGVSALPCRCLHLLCLPRLLCYV